jgi:hypothetical protein
MRYSKENMPEEGELIYTPEVHCAEATCRHLRYTSTEPWLTAIAHADRMVNVDAIIEAARAALVRRIRGTHKRDARSRGII